MTDYAISLETAEYYLTLKSLTLNRQKFASTQSGHGFKFSEVITASIYYEFVEDVGFVETVVPAWVGTRALSQNFNISSFDISAGFLAELTTTVNLSTDLSSGLKLVLQDILNTLTDLSSSGIYSLNISTQLFIQDLIYNVIPGVLASGIGISELTTIVQGTTILEQISIQHNQEYPFTYTLQLAELLNLNSSLQNFFGLSASDSFNFIDQSSSQFISYPVIENSLTLASVLGSSIVFRVTASENISIDDQDIIQQILSGLLDDTVEIVAGYITPSGAFTTWAVNVRSGATTEYSNYNFNSFAYIGNKYLGASSTGLYELLGDNDDGDTIISTITSGLFQVAGSHFTSFKAAYIGVRGQGDYLLKLISGEGQEYIYRVTAQSMKSARVNFGKGLRSRYFSYELQNIDQDFDLDTIEFLPIGANRRV